MRITIINNEKKEKGYSRVGLDEFVAQLSDGTYRQHYVSDFKKDVCFAAEWVKTGGELRAKSVNPLVLLSLENLRDLPTVAEYKRLAMQQPYTLLCFIGHDGHSLHIICPYSLPIEHSSLTIEHSPLTIAAPDHAEANNGQRSICNVQSLQNAFRKLHYIYSSQLRTPLSEQEPTLTTSCKASYDPQPYYNPAALAITVGTEPEETPAFRSQQEDISDYNYPEEIPGLSVRDSRLRRFHDCLDAAIEAHRSLPDDELFQEAVLERLADGCRQMGLPQAWAARMAAFVPMLGGEERRDAIEAVFKTAYLRQTLTTIPMKFTRPSALLTYKTEAYMREHYTLRLNMMTGTPEYRLNADGYGFQPLDKQTRNAMSIKALKAGVDSWDKDLSRYIDSSLIPRYYPMDDFVRHLPQWDGRHDYVGQLARRIKTANAHWEEDFHKWMLAMVAQWLGKDRQYGNAVVPLIVGPQGIGKTTFCSRLLPGWLQTYFNDRLSMKNDNDIFLAMSSYALINIDEFDTMSRAQQPLLKYLLSKHDVKFRPPYGKAMEERQRLASFIATTNNRRPLTDITGSRRFVCIYADDIDNTGNVPHNQLYAQLYAELQQGRRYWFNDDENQRLQQQNQAFQQVSSREEMVLLTYLPADATPTDAPFVPLRNVMACLAQSFPTFTVGQNTSKELGRKLQEMGYEHKKTNTGAATGY